MADENNLTTLSAIKLSLKPKPSGSITAVTPTNGGSGYTSAPTVTITDEKGVGALVHAVMTDGVITSFIIEAQGNDYVDPTVTITGGGGTGATATAEIDEDANLLMLIRQVSNTILGELPGLVVVAGTSFTEIHRIEGGGGIITLRKRPVTSIESVKIGGVTVSTLPDDADQLTADRQWRLDPQFNTLHLYTGVIGGYDGSYLRGVAMPENVIVTYKAGLPAGDPRLGMLERAAIADVSLSYKRRPFVHVTSESSAQGMGVTTSFITAAHAAETIEIIKRLNSDALAL